jgi:hypothetical protein
MKIKLGNQSISISSALDGVNEIMASATNVGCLDAPNMSDTTKMFRIATILVTCQKLMQEVIEAVKEEESHIKEC